MVLTWWIKYLLASINHKIFMIVNQGPLSVVQHSLNTVPLFSWSVSTTASPAQHIPWYPQGPTQVHADNHTQTLVLWTFPSWTSTFSLCWQVFAGSSRLLNWGRSLPAVTRLHHRHLWRQQSYWSSVTFSYWVGKTQDWPHKMEAAIRLQFSKCCCSISDHDDDDGVKHSWLTNRWTL